MRCFGLPWIMPPWGMATGRHAIGGESWLYDRARGRERERDRKDDFGVGSIRFGVGSIRPDRTRVDGRGYKAGRTVCSMRLDYLGRLW